jgi:endonuclease/exonuclease/phosphatase family metal-dependent hydrolase
MKRGADSWLEGLLIGAAALFFAVGFGFNPLPAGSFDSGQREAGSLRVVTWNVGRPGGLDEEALEAGLVEHVAQTIAELEPDLVFLQEVKGRAQLEELRLLLGRHWNVEISEPGGLRVAALAPRGELKSRRFSAAPKRSLSVTLKLGRGRELLALGLHADAWSSTSRNDEIGRSTDLLLGARGPGLRILLGDLNLDLDLDKRGDLFSDDSHLDVETYNYLADRMLDVARGTGFTAEPDRRLDYLFVTTDRVTVTQAGPWRGHRVGGMDHEPLVADLLLD